VSSLHARLAMLRAFRAELDANGGGAAHFYAAPQPANEEEPPVSAPLAIVALASPTCGAVDVLDGQATLVLQSSSGLAAASGQISWVRFVDGAGAAVEDRAAGLPDSGLAVTFTNGQTPPSAQVFTGGVINIVNAAWVL
jgi:hypothetical protein